jgi:hypothetical protein
MVGVKNRAHSRSWKIEEKAQVIYREISKYVLAAIDVEKEKESE